MRSCADTSGYRRRSERRVWMGELTSLLRELLLLLEAGRELTSGAAMRCTIAQIT